MSEENIAALHEVYAEWAVGNWRPRFELYADDFEWDWSEEFPESSGFSGDPERASERLRAWLSPWEEWRCEAEDYVAAGDYVVALTRYSGKGKGSGVDVNTEGAHVWKFAGGKVIRLEVFSSREKALAAAGIE